MNDDLMLEYMLQMGQMRPEQEQMLRKQKQVDALRQMGAEAPQSTMVGKQMVAPSWAQYAGQLGNAYAAKKGQQGVDAGAQSMNDRQRQMLEEMRRRQQMARMPTYQDNADPYGMSTGGGMAFG